MKKQDLKNFDVVECRNGSRRVVVGTKLMHLDRIPNSLNNYMDDLTDIDGSKDYDIMKVWSFYYVESITECLKGRNINEPGWKRTELPEYTMEELQKILGHSFKIVNK